MERLIGWNYPLDEWIKVNMNGAIKQLGRSTFMWGVICGNVGKLIKAFVCNLGSHSTIEVEI